MPRRRGALALSSPPAWTRVGPSLGDEAGAARGPAVGTRASDPTRQCTNWQRKSFVPPTVSDPPVSTSGNRGTSTNGRLASARTAQLLGREFVAHRAALLQCHPVDTGSS